MVNCSVSINFNGLFEIVQRSDAQLNIHSCYCNIVHVVKGGFAVVIEKLNIVKYGDYLLVINLK